MPSLIEDYALIGDCHTAALVGKDGSIDWLCLPRFDSPACFAALLGTPENGRWLLAPASEIRDVRRRYRGDSLILETEYETDGGQVAVIDFMSPRTKAPDLIRIVEGRSGQARMRMDLTLRFDYGWIIPWVRHIENGIRAVAGPDTVYCRSKTPMRGEAFHTTTEFTVSAGQQVAFDLGWTSTYGPEPEWHDAREALRKTEEFWREWASRCTYQGPWRDAVIRSLMTLKALTFAPTGGIVAAPTTSLPEKIGGVRNWDYRYCWLRDATFTLFALLDSGYTEEAGAWREWLVNTVAGTPANVQIMYSVTGERRITELELDWLPGYERSLPVRIGNQAHHQHQLDVYGEVMDALNVARRSGLEPSENAWRVQRAMLEFLESDWYKPDEGIWEVRGPRRHFTHSKVMAWVAMDRAVTAVEEFGVTGDADKWRRIREEIHQQVCREGYDPQLNSFVQYYGSRETDASLLMLPLVGFLPARDPRMIGTVQRIQETLQCDGLVRRYREGSDADPLPPGEGAFLLCTFWLADNFVLQGRYEEAREQFERLLDLRNDVGLLSEEYDPANRRMLGNFPQAFSHVGLINTANNLTRARGPAERRPIH